MGVVDTTNRCYNGCYNRFCEIRSKLIDDNKLGIVTKVACAVFKVMKSSFDAFGIIAESFGNCECSKKMKELIHMIEVTDSVVSFLLRSIWLGKIDDFKNRLGVLKKQWSSYNFGQIRVTVKNICDVTSKFFKMLEEFVKNIEFFAKHEIFSAIFHKTSWFKTAEQVISKPHVSLKNNGHGCFAAVLGFLGGKISKSLKFTAVVIDLCGHSVCWESGWKGWNVLKNAAKIVGLVNALFINYLTKFVPMPVFHAIRIPLELFPPVVDLVTTALM